MKRAIILLFLAVPALAEDGGIRIVSWPTPPAAASVSSAAVSATSVSSTAVTLATARTGRVKIVLFNEKETLYIKAGTGVSVTDYSWRLAAASQMEIAGYSGPVTAVLGVVGPTTVHVSDF